MTPGVCLFVAMRLVKRGGEEISDNLYFRGEINAKVACWAEGSKGWARDLRQ